MKTDKNTGVIYQYEFDASASLPANLIKDEPLTISTKVSEDQKFAIPKFAPFFTNDIRVVFKGHTAPAPVTLKEGVDYVLSINYLGATERTGKMVYGGISFLNNTLDGVVYLTYRTMGGDQIVDRDYILKRLMESGYNPRTATWDFLIDKPPLFPPVDHDHNLNAVEGLKELVEALEKLGDANAESSIKIADAVTEFLSSFDVNNFKRLLFDLERSSFSSVVNEQRVLNNSVMSNELRIKRLEELSGLSGRDSPAGSVDIPGFTYVDTSEITMYGKNEFSTMVGPEITRSTGSFTMINQRKNYDQYVIFKVDSVEAISEDHGGTIQDCAPDGLLTIISNERLLPGIGTFTSLKKSEVSSYDNYKNEIKVLVPAGYILYITITDKRLPGVKYIESLSDPISQWAEGYLQGQLYDIEENVSFGYDYAVATVSTYRSKE